MSAGIPREIAQKMDDLAQTLECTEENLRKSKAQCEELKDKNEQLELEIMKLKARLWDMASVNWY